ncbi:MAG TPA: MraY family glycosyltransferase [Pseudothermotoga sp.]|nr:MraY family glycosyltransferase [Pseudothermotoga sp.]HOK83628.1 MraY family glycosyltransferase [Pseudothermotoga sp.]HPP69267.1 MraY family glycosyltransferase [Pseudothermotoga sp.]
MIGRIIISFLISLVVTPFAMYLGEKLKIVDKPDGVLKTHQRVVPYLGGVAIYAGVAPFLPDMKLLFLATVMFVIGLVDDIKSVVWYVRLGAELLVGWFLGISFAQSFITSLLYSVLFVIVVNATNMIDGMDGVCATITVIGMMFSGQSSLQWAVIGSVGGYLVYNFPPAKIFMGDAGSYFIGSIISYTIFANLKTAFDLRVFLTFWILFLDIFSGVARRIIARRSPFMGDRDHIYDKIWRRVNGSKLQRDRKTVLLMAALAIGFSFLKYVEFSILIAFLGSIVVVLSLRMFWYDEGGNNK